MSSGLRPFDDEAVTTEGPLPILEKYRILRKLAAGGMASIYIAEQRGSGEICVVKILHEHLAKDSVVGNRFLREARVASELRHKNIARLMDAKSENGVFYLAMEFIAGHDLESMMFRLMEQRKMLPPELSIRVTLDVLAGLHHAHDYLDADGRHLEIVHRDLSPRNVMITYEGDVKIIDFGLARTNLGEFRTAPGMVLGTLRYMSPEQAVAEPVDRRSDLYSWSVVLYEMLSGRPLVVGVNAQEILHAVVTRLPPPLSALNPSMPKDLDAVLAKGMAKEREERFSGASEMADAIAKAAPELCKTKQSKIGRFVASVFPDERMSADDLRRPQDDGPDYEPTRAGQNDLTAGNVPMPMPIVAALPSDSSDSGELTPEHFAPTNIYVAPTSMVSVPHVPPRRPIALYLLLLLAMVALLSVIAVQLAPPVAVIEPVSVEPAVELPAPVVVKQIPSPVEKPAKVVVPQRAAAPLPPPAPPVRKELPAIPVEKKKAVTNRYPWENEVEQLLAKGRESDAAAVVLRRAERIDATEARQCAYDLSALGGSAEDVYRCASKLREAEQKQ